MIAKSLHLFACLKAVIYQLLPFEAEAEQVNQLGGHVDNIPRRFDRVAELQRNLEPEK